MHSRRGGLRDDILYPSTIPFVLVHLSCLAAIWSGVTWTALALRLRALVLRMFAVSRAIIAISRIAPSRPAGRFNSCSRSSRKAARKERAVVGGEAPAPSPPFRYRRGRAFAAPQGLYLQPPRLDLRSQARSSRPHQGGGFHALARAGWLKIRAVAGGGAGRPVLLVAGWSGLWSASCGARCWSITLPSASTRWRM